MKHNRPLLNARFYALLFASFALFFGAFQNARGADWRPEDRWFYASFGVGSDAQADELISLIERGSKVGLNGMLWAIGWESCENWSSETRARFERIKNAADENDVEIIPILWSVGYGTMLGKNSNLAEGLPVKDLPMIARDGKITFAPEDVAIPNGDMEEWNENRLVGAGFHDKPGSVSFRDDKIVRSGKSSIRFENFGSDKYGHGRLLQEVELTPGRIYRASIWIKAEKVKGTLMLQVYDMDGAQLTTARPTVETDDAGRGSCDWTRVATVFRVPANGRVRVYSGVWDGKEGTFWLDNATVEPVGLVNPLQRPGTPITVTSDDGKIVYEEGKDWILPKFQLKPWNPDAESVDLTIPEGSRIQEGENLNVDFYYPPLVGAPQIGTCMSEPELYELFERNAQEIVKILNPKKWFLSMDEIRCAGTCRACKDRGISLAAILGDCVTRQYEIIRKAKPGAEVYIWSDMLDPNHNACDNYYVCDGDYTGVWDLIPKDLIVSCWYYEKREASLKFFSARGFRTQGAAYYDTDDLNGCVDWFEECAKTPKCSGIMYTTWRHKYDLLEGFGKMIENGGKL